jgi:threonine synthase
LKTYQGVVEKYRRFLPVSKATPIVTMLEGKTPLIPSRYLGKELNLNLFFKYEGANPTGSFKDRGMTMAISKALEKEAKAVMCASTGNTSASAAAYAARAGLKCIVLIPGGKIAQGKLAQALVHGARVIALKGNFDEALEIVRNLTDKHPIELVNSINPYRLQGQKTAAFEVCDTLGKSPDYLVIPVGNAGNITAYWMGFKEYYEKKVITSLPRLIGFQAAGAAPLVLGHPVENPETIATAIRIGQPARGEEALRAAEESGGTIDKVTDEEIIKAYKLLASREGIFAEPASAAAVAGLIKKAQAGYFSAVATCVVVLTGHGLKDPERAVLESEKMVELKASLSLIEEFVLEELND